MRLGSWLCDVPLPQQRGGRDDEDREVGDEREDRLVRADRRRGCVSERRRCERAQQRGRILAVEPVGDPIVSAAVEGDDEPDDDDLHREDIDQADAERRRRLPEQGAECHPERAVHGHDRHPRLKDDDATSKRREPARPLGEDGLQSSPRVLGARDQRAQHDGHGGSEREAGAHDVVDELIREQGQYRHRLTRSPWMSRLVPLGRVEEHHDARDETGRNQERRAKSVLTPFSFDACDHDPCFSPVSWKKASSSDLSIGLNSLTPMPAAVSRLLISSVLEGSVLSLIEPFCMLTAAAPNIPVKSSNARSMGWAVTSTPSSPSRSCTVDWVTSLPPRMTPTRSQICSTSGSRWLERSTVRLPWPMSLMSLRISAMTCGSSPLVGSSRMRSSGSLSSAAATPSRCFMPVE